MTRVHSPPPQRCGRAAESTVAVAQKTPGCFSTAFPSDLRLCGAQLRLRDNTKIGCADGLIFCSSGSRSVETGLPTVYHAAFN